MDISTKGLIEIMGHEGVCLSPYLDSVGVWTIGVGITEYDGVSPKNMGPLTIDQAIDLFKYRVRSYVQAVQKLNLGLTQTQFDALVSFCYNVGEGNLRKLVRNRSIEQIGDALMLYNIPAEIVPRRAKEQKLFKTGVYSGNGKVIVFPVSAKHKPIYKDGFQLDVSKYFNTAPAAKPAPAPAPTPAAPVKKASLVDFINALINLIVRLFK
jgi:lysozyme